jgi:hypothetical protein
MATMRRDGVSKPAGGVTAGGGKRVGIDWPCFLGRTPCLCRATPTLAARTDTHEC